MSYVIEGNSGSGAQGAQGSSGSAGSQGSQGHQGTTGTGSQGAQGSLGTGAQGAAGSAGSQGATGAQGAQGSIGPVAGSDTQVIYNDGGAAAGNGDFTYDKNTDTVSVNNLHVAGNLMAAGITAGGYSTLGSITGRWSVLDGSGNVAGYIPFYDSIT